jgi:hypothetical protein
MKVFTRRECRATIRTIAREAHVAQGTICRIHIRKE